VQAEERQYKIYNYLQEKEFCSLDELSEILNTSISSIRRDVNRLEKKGLIRRTHGGARLTDRLEPGNLLAAPNISVLADVKKKIGFCCASLISPGQTIIMDGGSTVYSVAQRLMSKHPIVITNSLPIANLYSSYSQVEVHVTGGVIYPRLGVLTGPKAVEGFSKIHADVAIMGAGGLTLDEGVTNTHALLIDMQLAMIHAAQKVIFCMDSTKLSRRSLFFLCAASYIQTLVTDSGADPKFIKALRSKGIEVHIAGEKPAEF
ncbi:MAG: DeoR/GlpR transcriptional regulator, partial [Verrucomicrobia bacterium]|nr:DeoR/GlpR transcriptional regulator [Verrucomicrobiota bacterium]